MGEGEGGEEKGLGLGLGFSLPSFPFSPETPDTQATCWPSPKVKPNLVPRYHSVLH